jgi:hypothetical protein
MRFAQDVDIIPNRTLLSGEKFNGIAPFLDETVVCFI